jgi:hypothetical protein
MYKVCNTIKTYKRKQDHLHTFMSGNISKVGDGGARRGP